MLRSYVALGDSFTEGLDDPYPDGVTFRGWADRLAELLASRDPDFRYANLAIRGKLLSQIIAEQLPPALAAAPDLVSLCAGGNDMMRGGADPDALGAAMDDAVRRLRMSGAQVLLFTGADPRNVPILRRTRPKVVAYNAHLRRIATYTGVMLVDLWAMDTLYDWRAWSEDRLHLSAAGHELVACHAAEVLGVPAGDWRTPWPAAVRPGWLHRRRADVRWVRVHLGPWVIRRLRGRSSGDGLLPKRPELTAWSGFMPPGGMAPRPPGHRP